VNTNGRAHRIALAVGEARRDLGLSLRELSRWSGVSRDTISRLERGDDVRPDLIVRVAAALVVLELHAPQPVTVAKADEVNWYQRGWAA
jgi:transcriptional regulator with XRE-family HTH domain